MSPWIRLRRQQLLPVLALMVWFLWVVSPTAAQEETGELPTTAEQLMRSRYCAFVKQDADYLLHTHDPATRSKNLKKELQASMGTTTWIRLEVIQTIAGLQSDTQGFVRFIAHYMDKGKPGRLEELSRFTKIKGKWYYTDGQHA